MTGPRERRRASCEGALVDPGWPPARAAGPAGWAGLFDWLRVVRCAGSVTGSAIGGAGWLGVSGTALGSFLPEFGASDMAISELNCEKNRRNSAPILAA